LAVFWRRSLGRSGSQPCRHSAFSLRFPRSMLRGRRDIAGVEGHLRGRGLVRMPSAGRAAENPARRDRSRYRHEADQGRRRCTAAGAGPEFEIMKPVAVALSRSAQAGRSRRLRPST
jgi:hypothetical protein